MLLLGACGSDGPADTNPAIERFDVSPEHLMEPGEITIHWTTRNTDSIELKRGDETVDLGNHDVAQGSVAVALTESAIFTLEARGKGKAATATRSVTVEPLRGPFIAELSAPELVEANAAGEAIAEISWAGVVRAQRLRLEAPGRAPLDLDAAASEGSVEVSLTETTTFTLIATNPADEVSRSVTVEVAHLPVIERFSANRMRVGSGEEVTVEWSTSGAAYVELWDGEVQLIDVGPQQGSEKVAILLPSTLELRAINAAGTTEVATLEIETGPPIVDAFEAVPETLWLGQNVNIRWEIRGGSTLELTLDPSGETVCEVDEIEAIESSSCEWQPPEPGVYSLSLSVSNLSGIETDSRQVYVGNGPLISHFGVGPEVLSAGDDLEIRWKVLRDPAGNEPTVHLADDQGNDYGAQDAEGLLTTSLEAPGPYEFRLEASSDHPDSTLQWATAKVFVHPLPDLHLAATPPVFDDSQHEEVVISWTSRGAEGLILYELIDGAEVQVLEILGADREEGSFRYVPTEVRRFRLVATNAIGAKVSDEVVVELAPTEVLTLSAEPTAFAQGQEITLRWTTRMADEVRINMSTEGYLLEETAAPYLDLPALGGVPLPLGACGGAIETHGCASIDLPDGFRFPFGGSDVRRAWIFTPGYVGFGSPGSPQPPTEPENDTFPSEPGLAGISLAPFWDTLAWDTQRYPAGNIYTALLEENEEEIFVIQWKDIGYDQASGRGASLNFEVVLREDGSFDYRYGVQSPMGTNLSPAIINGGSATIGFQLPDQSDFGLLLHNGAGSLNGLRDHRTFSYRPLPPLPLSGELSFRPLGPQADFPIIITAIRGEASHSRSIDLQVTRRPLLELTPETIAPVAMGETFRIGWKSSNAESLVVLDESGEVICVPPTQDQVEEGLCAHSEETSGTFRYTIRAIGAHGSFVDREIQVRVFGAFGVASFTATPESVEIGSNVLLEWLVYATQSVRVFADGVVIFSDDSGATGGRLLVEDLTTTTEFKLVATNSLGAEDEAVLEVPIWPITFGMQASATTVRPGDEVTIFIDARTLDGGTPLTVYGLLPLVEDTDAANRYADISTLPDVTNLNIGGGLTNTTVEIELPFPFPYMGDVYEKLWSYTDGYVSFTPLATNYATNQRFPAAVSHAIHAHIAPFWDDLHPRGLGEMHTAAIGNDTFVIQWSKMSLTSGSNNTNPHHLNFQLVLHRSGAFEFRYGAMEPHPTYRPPSGCFPNTCENEVNGAAATIGYQTLGAAAGYNFHFGGSFPNEENLPVPGGLSNRTLRYPLTEGSGRITFRLDETQTFSLCAKFAGEPICREFEISVPFGFASVSLSREQLAYGEPTTLSWHSFGGKSLRVLEGEKVIFETTDLGEIDSHSIELRPTRSTIYDVELRAGSRVELVQKVVEMDRFSLTATASASTIIPNDPVTISWNLTSNDPSLSLQVIKPMEEISNASFYDLDLSADPDAVQLIGANNNNSIVQLNFQDFVFPYFGTEHSSINVAGDGYLTWAAGLSSSSNSILPNQAAGAANVALAPFWDDLHTRQSGRVFAKKVDADRYVIQWSRVSLQNGSTNANEGDLNFLIVLHRDGSFEYRYGVMRPPPMPAGSETQCNPLSCERETDASSATIGYQLLGGVAGFTLHFGGSGIGADQPVVARGLANRSWRFTPHSGTGPGSVQVHPVDKTVYSICAVEVESGEVVCAAPVVVEAPWGIDFFHANPHAPLAGQPVTLSWSVQGLDRLTLLADGSPIASHIGPSIPLLGSESHTPLSDEITYTLEGISLERKITRELVVRRRTFDLEVTGPSGILAPGDVIDISWELTQHVPGDAVMITPLSEVPIGPGGEDGYMDISQLEGAQEISLQAGSTPANNGSASILIPFSFPFLGTQQTSLDVYVDGYISFAGAGGNSIAANTVLPAQSTTSTTRNVHLAVFWDDLYMRGGASIWRHSPDPDTLIIQWKAFSRSEGSSESVRYDLNFQVVLRSDGSFDYRYGRMAPPPPPFSYAHCRPEDCSAEANGSSATVGYQTFDSMFGSTLHIGSLTTGTGITIEGAPTSGYLVFPGGLSNRTFRYSPASKGSSKVVVGRSGPQEVCAIVGNFSECESVHIEVVAAAGDLMFTELMIDPSGGRPEQWFEIRNLTSRTIDLEGFVIESQLGEHTIVGSLPVGSGEFVTLAASDQVPFTPDYVYGGDLPLDRNIDRLELIAGRATIAIAAWGIDWDVPRNQVLGLVPRFHLTNVLENRDFGRWCHSGPFGSPGTLGEGCLDEPYDIDPISDRPFIDISSTGTRFSAIEGDDLLARLHYADFQVKLFGETYSRIWVSTNGWISLHDLLPTTNPATRAPLSIPRSPAQVATFRGPLIVGFWEILRCNDRCRVYHERREVEGEEVLIVQWEEFVVSFHDALTITFQIQLWESGDVVSAFGPIVNPYRPGTSQWTPIEGSTAVVGLENGDGSVFLDAHFRRPLGFDRRAIHFRVR